MPIRDFLMDENNDIAVVNHDFALAGDKSSDPTDANKAAVVQGIKIRGQMFLGEAYLDQSIGVPYLQDILIKNPNPLIVQADLATAIAGTPDVVTVISAGLVGPTPERSASIAFSILSKYSEEVISGTVDVPPTAGT